MANFRTFREAQSDIRARLNSDASELAGLPARFKALEVERRREAKSPKELKDNLDSLEKNFNKEKDKLEQSITSGTEKFEFLEAAFPLLQQLETDGQLPCRVFASYETHEIDLANFTGKSRIEKATTNPQ